MPATKLNDVINPQVMGDMIEAKINAQAKLIPYAKVDTTLQGVPGDTKTVPSWNYIGDAQDFDPENEDGDEIELTNLTAGSTTFTIKCAAKSIGILQTAINSGLGNPVGQSEKQLADSIIGKVDNDLLDAVNAVAGVYTIKIDTKASNGDKIIINGVPFVAGTDFLLSTDTATGNATALAAKLNDSENEVLSCYTWTSSGTTITATEDSGKEGSGLPAVVTEGSMKVVTATTTKGVAAASAAYLCPVIKMEPDSPETEYTEDELPALTIFLKKDTQVDHEWLPKKQRHDITAAKYYGVALTNSAKVVLGKFGK